MYTSLCEFAHQELGELDRKAKSGKLSVAEIEYGDTLAHMWKCLLTAEAMETADGYSERSMHYGPDGRWYGGRSYNGRSYGDGMSYADRQPRDSMGRYSGNVYPEYNSVDTMRR